MVMFFLSCLPSTRAMQASSLASIGSEIKLRFRASPRISHRVKQGVQSSHSRRRSVEPVNAIAELPFPSVNDSEQRSAVAQTCEQYAFAVAFFPIRCRVACDALPSIMLVRNKTQKLGICANQSKVTIRKKSAVAVAMGQSPLLDIVEVRYANVGGDNEVV